MAVMQIKTTERMARYIRAMKDELRIEDAQLVHVNKNFYILNGGDVWNDWDFDYAGKHAGTYRMLRVEYPAADYACPLYITTAMLSDEFNKVQGNSENSFREALRNLIMI